MKKRFALAVIVITAIALSLVGCGVKVTNISVPDAATLEKGEHHAAGEFRDGRCTCRDACHRNR